VVNAYRQIVAATAADRRRRAVAARAAATAAALSVAPVLGRPASTPARARCAGGPLRPSRQDTPRHRHAPAARCTRASG
jgi:hypothetical protein